MSLWESGIMFVGDAHRASRASPTNETGRPVCVPYEKT